MLYGGTMEYQDMIFDSGKGDLKGWILKEDRFNAEFPRKCESIMCLGNGYMGLRSAMENYLDPKSNKSRMNFVAGTFDYMEGDEATELPNLPDVTNMQISLDGEAVVPTGKIEGYERTLNLKNGLLRRAYTWESESGKKLELEFLRMVSLDDLHLICAEINIKALDGGKITIDSGISTYGNYHQEHLNIWRVTSKSGVLQMNCETKQSKIKTITSTYHKAAVNGAALENLFADYEVCGNLSAIIASGSVELGAGDTLTITKTSSVFTNRDKERNECEYETLYADTAAHMNSVRDKSFAELLAASAAAWERKVWSIRDIKIDSVTPSDQIAARFAIYHLTVMSPTHDNRMNIGAKGLSGSGYRGHAFWDTEIFMLPYFVYTNPIEAKSLLEYRYNCLNASRELAKQRGFEGAMFPWEASWITDGETTPSWCQTGEIEIHITADIAAAVYNYFVVTGDEQFMRDCGYELILETAKFWASRLEWNRKTRRYELTNVIGPNEYKENIDNNAFTNYLARYNMQLAVKYANELKASDPALYGKLNAIVGIDELLPVLDETIERIYLPVENEEGILPENDTFLSLPDIIPDIEALGYKTASEAGRIAHEACGKYGGINECMVLKQADVVLLMYMFEDFFTAESKKKNYYFYEKRCFHDSSLSMSTYASISADLHEKETAYKMFNRATMIDMGPLMWSSDEGIHSASLGGIWQCCVMGFGGVRRYGEQLRIQPNLPDEWNSVSYAINWKGQRLEVVVDHNELNIKNVTGTADVEFLCGGKTHTVRDEITLNYKD